MPEFRNRRFASVSVVYRLGPICAALAVVAILSITLQTPVSAAPAQYPKTDTDGLSIQEKNRLLAKQSRETTDRFLNGKSFGESIDRAEIRSFVSRMLVNDDFEALEYLGSIYRDRKLRTSSGLWKLTIFYSGFNSAAPRAADDDEAWLKIFRVMRAWRKTYPQSSLPIVASSILLEERAWKYARGGLIPDAADLAQRNFEASYELLKANEAIARNDPHYQTELVEHLLIRRAEPADFMEALNHGIGVEPGYYQLYFVAMNYFSPRWYGDARQLEAFASTAASRLRESEGESLYARIYWYASQSTYGLALFQKSNVDWPRMRQGIDDVLARFPDDWNVNHFALFSCLAGDPQKTSELMEKMGEVRLSSVWDRVPGSYTNLRRS